MYEKNKKVGTRLWENSQNDYANGRQESGMLSRFFNIDLYVNVAGSNEPDQW